MSGAKGKASDTAGSLFDRVKVPVLVILVFPLFGAFLSSTACLSLAVAGFNLSWLLFKGLWTEGRAAAEKRLGDAYDEFAVASWLVLYLVATPFGLVAIILSLVLLGFSSSVYVQAFHRVLVTAFAVYCLWAYLWDDSVNRGGMANPKLRDAAYFKHLARYFDLKMTVDHDEADDGGAAGGSGSEGEAKDHHIFCYHPHGIVFWGVIAGFASHAVSSTVTFKGQRLSDLDIRMGTISFNNLVPLFREINKNLGCFNVSRKVCERALRDNKNILIVPGGAREAISAYPGTMNVLLKNRKGFVRLALSQGVPLVPVLSFGESDMYNMMEISPDTTLFRVQRVYQQLFGFTVPIFWGRRLLGVPTVMPLRREIHIVVGRPLEVKKFAGDLPSDRGKGEVEALHQRYCQALQALYHKHKDKHKHPVSGLKVL